MDFLAGLAAVTTVIWVTLVAVMIFRNIRHNRERRR